MSQCYHIELKQAVARVVRAEDSVSYPIELTEILPPEAMKETLRRALAESGWVSANDREFTATGPGGENLVVDLETMELTATVSAEKEVAAEVKANGQGESNRTARRNARIQMMERAAAAGDRIEDSGMREVQKEATDRLSESETARLRQLNDLLQRVYTEALKQKAGQLGEILEVRESTSDEGSYELLIRVAQ